MYPSEEDLINYLMADEDMPDSDAGDESPIVSSPPQTTEELAFATSFQTASNDQVYVTEESFRISLGLFIMRMDASSDLELNFIPPGILPPIQLFEKADFLCTCMMDAIERNPDAGVKIWFLEYDGSATISNTVGPEHVFHLLSVKQKQAVIIMRWAQYLSTVNVFSQTVLRQKLECVNRMFHRYTSTVCGDVDDFTSLFENN